MRKVALAWIVVAAAACGPRRSGTWGETDVGTDHNALAPPSGSATVVCEAPRFLDVKVGTGRALPTANMVRAATLTTPEPGGRARVDVADVSAILQSAAVLDACDPSVAQAQYAPDGVALVELEDGTKLRLTLFVGARAALAWPDGTGVLFDFGPAAPWLPKAAQPFLRRDFHRDADCKNAEHRPHRIAFEPPAEFDAKETRAQLQVTCSPLGGGAPTAWCCP